MHRRLHRQILLPRLLYVLIGVNGLAAGQQYRHGLHRRRVFPRYFEPVFVVGLLQLHTLHRALAGLLETVTGGPRVLLEALRCVLAY